MVNVVFMVTVVCVAFIWSVRKGWWRTHTAQLPQGGIPHETLALEPFM